MTDGSEVEGSDIVVKASIGESGVLTIAVFKSKHRICKLRFKNATINMSPEELRMLSAERRSMPFDLTKIVGAGMHIEDQKHMALEGVHTWGHGVIRTNEQIASSQGEMFSALVADQAIRRGPFDVADAQRSAATAVSLRRQFQLHRHAFLISAKKLIEFIEWALEVDVAEREAFDEVLQFSDDIKWLRDANEHVIEYFKGGGRNRADWERVDADGGFVDPSSTSGTLIGGRLDRIKFSASVQSLIGRLPPVYWPNISPIERIAIISAGRG